MTIKELNRQHPELYVMVTYEFGKPVFVAPTKNLRTVVTEIKENAELWSYADTISPVKLEYNRAATGFEGLIFEMV